MRRRSQRLTDFDVTCKVGNFLFFTDLNVTVGGEAGGG